MAFAANSLDHFAFAPVGDQTAGVGFTITITAENSSNSVVAAYNGYVLLTDAAGKIGPTTTGPFVNGVWSGPISVTQTIVGNVLTATHPVSPAITGSSNPFTVSHSAVVTVTVSPDPETITASDSVTYTVWATDTFGNGWDATAEAAYAAESGAGGAWAGNVYTSEFAGTWTVTATVKGTADTALLTVGPHPSPPMYYIYLPLVQRNHPASPDLVIQNITATRNNVQVVIKNQGGGPVASEF